MVFCREVNVLYTDKNIMTAFIGLAQEADRLFERDYRLTQIKNGLRIEYDEVVQRISTELDISECNDSENLHRIKKAVWDTGATTSSISNRLAEHFGLRPVDVGIIVTATGQVEVPIYMLDLHLTKDIILKNIKVFGSPMENRDVDFLVGMDVISKGKFIVDSTGGGTSVSFTM